MYKHLALEAAGIKPLHHTMDYELMFYLCVINTGKVMR
jgi:hypothetical protein